MSNVIVTKISDVLKAMDALTGQVQQLSYMLQGMENPQTVTIYSQRDLEWAANKIAGTAYTIGSEGCLMTCAASMLTDAGRLMTPDLLNEWLMANAGYVIKDGHSAFVWASIDKLGVVKFVNKVSCWDTPAPMVTIDATLKAGGFVLVEVDFNPDPDRDQHWVRLLNMAGDVMDPWTGEIIPITHYRGANLSQCVRGAAFYKRVI